MIEKKSRYLDELKRRVLIFDGAMGTQVQACELSDADFGGKEGCNDYLAVVNPGVIEQIHTSYFEAGADVVETDTFQASRLKLDEYGIGETTYEVNFSA
ncbi:MAG: homocysteine S-methyltransferase family protein, partial [Dehalococcoidia bacterium]